MLAAVSPIIRPLASEPLDVFAAAVYDAVERGDLVIVDCSDLDVVRVGTIRMLEAASRRTTVILINASPVVCLLATTFDVAVQPRAHVALEPPLIDGSATSEHELLDELRDLVFARDRMYRQIEIREDATPHDLRVLRRTATRIDAIVATLRIRSRDDCIGSVQPSSSPAAISSSSA